MKITINKDIFSEKLSLAAKFTSNKLTSLNALQGVMLFFDKTNLHFYASNLSSYFHSFLKIETEKETRLVIDPRKIIEFINLLPAGKIEIDIKEKQLVIITGKTKGSFSFIEFEDFPIAPKTEGKTDVLNKDLLENKLPLVLFSASSDESRPVLTGVNLTTDANDFIVVATDGFRLSLFKSPKTQNFPSLIIPANILEELTIFNKKGEAVNFSYSEKEKTITFILSDSEICTRLIEGDFPPYEKVIPSESKTTIILDREELLRNTKITSVFAKEFSNIVVFEINNEGLRIRPKIDSNEENITFQEIEFTGEPQKIAFNYRFLVDFLNQNKEKKIQIDILRSDAPIVFKPINKKDYLHIIMPVRIQE